MVIHYRDNQYLGINAHLHSYLQNEPAGWEEFHGVHITHLAEAIDRLLPPGYIVRSEKSMQIREFYPDSGDTLYLTALTIHTLSPTNKPGGSGALQYREKRVAALRGGLALVEIDYLHESPPVIALLPDYPVDEGVFPYVVLVTNPHPSLAEGEAHIYEIGIDMPLPIIKIPLAGTQFIALACGTVYNHTFSSLSTFSYYVDYSVQPVNFERYHTSDQEKIRARMMMVIQNSSENPT